MQIIVHTGAHHTDSDRLLKCLLSNAEDFTPRGIAIPGPGRYRTLIKESFLAMDAAEPAPDARDVLIDAILDDESAERMILSNEHFFGSPRFAMSDGQFYPLATRRLRQLRRLFQGDDIHMFMAIANPATFIPNVLGKAGLAHKREVLAANDPRFLNWCTLLGNIREVVPQVRVTVWCSEDSPLIWGKIIREIAGIDASERISGSFDYLRDIMTTEGMQRLRGYLGEHPELSEEQKHRVMSAFLGKFAIQDALDQELDLPGWTHGLVEELTEYYERDIQDIQNLEGVRVLLP